MEKAVYMDAQKKAFVFIDEWVRLEKTPMPKKELFKKLVLADISESTARKSIAALVTKGFIRRAATSTNQTFYVMLRSMSQNNI